MSTPTNIQWTDVVDNIIRAVCGGWWCRMISEGCINCYAAKINQSPFFGGNRLAYTGEPPKLKLETDIIKGWARQTKPKKHFVASMTDIFGDWVPREWIFQFLDGMAEAPKQTFQLLTKRADIMEREMKAWLRERERVLVPDNIWPGFSAENQARLIERYSIAKHIPTNRLWASFEPLLGPIDLSAILEDDSVPTSHFLQWSVWGGESGPNARRGAVDRIRDGLHQCRLLCIPVYVKQLGGNLSDEDLSLCARTSGKSMNHPKGGEPSEWPEDLRVREFPE